MVCSPQTEQNSALFHNCWFLVKRPQEGRFFYYVILKVNPIFVLI